LRTSGRAGSATAATGSVSGSSLFAASSVREQFCNLRLLSFSHSKLFLHIGSCDQPQAAASHTHLHAHSVASLPAGAALTTWTGTLRKRGRARDSQCEYKDSFHILV
jgi:hypothetical protein